MIYLLDSAAILNDFDFRFEENKEYLMTSSLVREIKDLRSRSLVDAALHNGFLKIQEPKPEFLQKAREKVSEQGTRLSEADLSLIALAIELNQKQQILVLTDDFSVQNALKGLKINFKGVFRGEIMKEKHFQKRCPNCKKPLEMASEAGICHFCGQELY